MVVRGGERRPVEGDGVRTVGGREGTRAMGGGGERALKGERGGTVKGDEGADKEEC